MKKLLLSTWLLLAACYSYGQDEGIKAITNENYNFKIIDGNVAWQFVYKTEKTVDEIRQHFERSRIIKVVNSDSVNMFGRADNQPVDYTKYGFSTGSVPMYIIGASCSYNIDINIKDGLYRVTIYNVVFNPAIKPSIMIGGNLQMTLNELSYNYKKNRFKGAFFSMNAAAVLSTVWCDTYLIKETPGSGNDW